MESNIQRDADQLILSQALKEKDKQIAELERTCLTAEEVKKMIVWIQEYADDVDVPMPIWVDSVLTKLKIQVGGKENQP